MTSFVKKSALGAVAILALGMALVGCGPQDSKQDAPPTQQQLHQQDMQQQNAAEITQPPADVTAPDAGSQAADATNPTDAAGPDNQ